MNRLPKARPKKLTWTNKQRNSEYRRVAMKEVLFPRQIKAAITGNPSLSLLGDVERKECIQQSSLFTIAKREALYRAGESADCVWAVANGQAKIVKQSHSGRSLLIEIIMPGETCGGICYSDNTRFVFSAFAMEETKALRFPLQVLQKSAETNPALSRALLKAADYIMRSTCGVFPSKMSQAAWRARWSISRTNSATKSRTPAQHWRRLLARLWSQRFGPQNRSARRAFWRRSGIGYGSLRCRL